MRRFYQALILAIVLSACVPPYTSAPTSLPTSLPTGTSMPPTPEPTSTPEPTLTPVTAVRLNRGVNFGNMLEAPNEGDWDLTVQEEYFDLVKEAGFDFIRLPVRWNTHTEDEWPYTIDPAFFARIDQVVSWALERNLTIIVDFHHYDEIMTDPWSHKDRFLGIWKQVADHYENYPSSVLFELLNEPNTTFDAQLWNQYLTEALAIVRESNPTRDVIIGPVNWNAYDWLSTLDVPNDEYLIVTFHYYLPFQFTHQGAEWVGDESTQWLGTEWGSVEEKVDVIKHFDSVADWAQRHGKVRILLGEFGVYDVAPHESRIHWTKFVREQAENHGFAWAYWELASGFGVYDPDAKVWRKDLLKALIP
ncbi:MAG TPA: glycoside hydrolase family 5 protein [Anaerolineales bacterium]|nr:glycoside hydrolase family 5 protein [Anaerolineales bacterium]